MASASQPFEARYKDTTLQLVNALELLLSSAKGLEPTDRRNEEIQEATFWEQLDIALKLLPHEVYKLAVMFAKPPLPSAEETLSLVAGLEKLTMNFYHVFYSIPHNMGKTLQTKIKKGVINALEALLKFSKALASKNSGMMTTAAGQVDELCTELAKIPRTNREMVRTIFKENLAFVEDALEELDEEIVNEPPQTEQTPLNGFRLQPSYHPWTEAELALLRAVQGLVKCAKSTIKKVSSTLLLRQVEQEYNANLDKLAAFAPETSNAVDNLVSECSHPLSYQIVQEYAVALKEFLEGFLQFAKTCPLTLEDDHKWIEFFGSAITHNITKITSPVMAMGLVTIGHEDGQ